MKKIFFGILVVAISLTVVVMWIVLAWIICMFLSVYVYESYALYWFIFGLISVYYIFKSITRINIFKGIVKLWNNIGKYLDLND